VPPKVYLAGPDVFLPNATELAEHKQRICREHGFEGVSAVDVDRQAGARRGRRRGWWISQCNEQRLRECDLLIANMTPFRGPSLDVGTAFEMGFMRALNRPVLGYTNAATDFRQRTLAWLGKGWSKRRDGSCIDADGMLVENYRMADNLMLEGAVLSSGAEVICRSVEAAKRWTDLDGFVACVKRARAIISRR
jgi:nucleoside 2-deoxyribosyltransferase